MSSNRRHSSRRRTRGRYARILVQRATTSQASEDSASPSSHTHHSADARGGGQSLQAQELRPLNYRQDQEQQEQQGDEGESGTRGRSRRESSSMTAEARSAGQSSADRSSALMWRRVGIWYAGLVAVGIAVFTALFAANQLAAGDVLATTTARNVVMVIVDDMRPVQTKYGQQQPWGRSFTPNLDRFAEGALTFTRAYAQVSLCSPSRTSFLTGQRPDRTRVWNLLDDIRSVNQQDGLRALTDPVVTLPEYIRSRGYVTNGFGKVFHSGKPQSNDWPLSFTERVQSKTTVTCQEKCGGKNWGTVPESRALGSSSLIDDCLICPTFDEMSTFEDFVSTNASIRSLRHHVRTRGADAPFFYILGLCKPHTPFRYPYKFWDMFPIDNLTSGPLPFTNRFPAAASPLEWVQANEIMSQAGLDFYNSVLDNETAWKIRLSYYHASAFADEMFGMLLDELDSLGIANSTTVVVFGDHGFHLGEQNMYAKRTLFERGTQVPLMVRSPWHPRTANLSTSAIVELVDIAPTLLDIVGILEEAKLAQRETGTLILDGQSLMPLMDAVQTSGLRGDAAQKYLDELEETDNDGAWDFAGESPLGTGLAFSQYARCGDHGVVDCDKIQRSRFSAMGYSVRTSKWRYCEWYKWNKSTLLPLVESGLISVDLFEHSDADENVSTDVETVNVLAQTDPEIVATLRKLLHSNFKLEI